MHTHTHCKSSHKNTRTSTHLQTCFLFAYIHAFSAVSLPTIPMSGNFTQYSDWDDYGDSHPLFNTSTITELHMSVKEEDFLWMLNPRNHAERTYVAGKVRQPSTYSYISTLLLNVLPIPMSCLTLFYATTFCCYFDFTSFFSLAFY